jgi:nucleotide-binding universal stress UspA family protein
MTGARPIVHPTERTSLGDAAFAHAVALCARSGRPLVIVHAGDAPATDLPSPEPLLERWGLAGAFEHHAIVRDGDDAAETVLEILERLEPDLVVCATHARTGVERVFAGSVAEAIARNLVCPTLLIPPDTRSLVDPTSGHFQFERVAIPARGPVEARAALEACERLLTLAGQDATEALLVHAEDGTVLGEVPASDRIGLQQRLVPPPLEDHLVQAARDHHASLVIMPTRGHDSLADILLGSHTERVLHAVGRPLLWVPLPPGA